MENQTEKEKHQRKALRKKIKRWKAIGLDTKELEGQFNYRTSAEFREATKRGTERYWGSPAQEHVQNLKSQEFSKKGLASALKGWNDPVYVDRQSKVHEEFYSIPENREAHSRRMKEALDTPEWRERCSRRKGPLAANWQGGISYEPYCHKFNDDFKHNVRTFFDNKCVLCLYEEVETPPQKRAFCVHHVHYDKQSLCNDTSPRMFAPLCDGHHAMTNGNRKFWEDLLSEIITDVYIGRSYYSEEEWNQMRGQVPAGLPEPAESAGA